MILVSRFFSHVNLNEILAMAAVRSSLKKAQKRDFEKTLEKMQNPCPVKPQKLDC
jgi:hypothetical protein